jgi:hypothetical protein
MKPRFPTYHQWSVIRMARDTEPYIATDGDFQMTYRSRRDAVAAVRLHRKNAEPGEYRKYGALRIACQRVQEVWEESK